MLKYSRLYFWRVASGAIFSLSLKFLSNFQLVKMATYYFLMHHTILISKVYYCAYYTWKQSWKPLNYVNTRD